MDLFKVIYDWIDWDNMDRYGKLKPELDDDFHIYGPLKSGAPEDVLQAYEEFCQQEREAGEEGVIIN